MDYDQKKFPWTKRWIDELVTPSQWEAPDRKFQGHRDILARSLARYHFIAPYAKGDMLEIGCGRGYGIEALRENTSRYVGVDISFAFLKDAQDISPDNYFIQSNGRSLPFQDKFFNSIIAFEVIEHIMDDVGFLAELKRLAVPGGLIAISTPNRIVTSGSATVPLDRFHIREYSPAEFGHLLKKVFSSVQIFGQAEKADGKAIQSHFIDHIPVSLKYKIPASIASRISVAIRPPLKQENIEFFENELHRAENLIAICQP